MLYMKSYMALLLISSMLIACTHNQHPKQVIYSLSTEFKSEGQLTVFLNHQPIKTLDIEIADDEAQITQGLMFRDSLEADQGMLFIYPDSDQRQFWMKNTRIPLDILYFDQNKRFLNVARHTEPFSLTGTPPSQGDAMYVLEVNAGLSDEWHLVPGQSKIEFTNYSFDSTDNVTN